MYCVGTGGCRGQVVVEDRVWMGRDCVCGWDETACVGWLQRTDVDGTGYGFGRSGLASNVILYFFTMTLTCLSTAITAICSAVQLESARYSASQRGTARYRDSARSLCRMNTRAAVAPADVDRTSKYSCICIIRKIHNCLFGLSTWVHG